MNYFIQVNYQFGRNVFLPYSVGRILAYYRKIDPEFPAEFIYLRDPYYVVIERMRRDPPEVVAFSLYIWNYEYSLGLANRIAREFPDAVLIAGGPSVPNVPYETMEPFNFHIHGEGEIPFAVLMDYLRYPPWILTKEKLPGYITEKGYEQEYRGEMFRAETLSDLPSPYLDGLFDTLVEDPRYQFHALQETNRGCPYSCTYCDWGSATMTKVREFPMQTIRDEIDWFSDRKIELVYNCDANFGIFERDVEIAKHLTRKKEESGFPVKFRAAYAKKTTPRVFMIGVEFAAAGMSKGVTMSAQSMNKETLKAVKRRPIDPEQFEEMVGMYHRLNVPTYTEIILGLPAETSDSFRDGLSEILHYGQDEGINVYPAIQLENAEMASPGTVEEWWIETVRVPMLLYHGTPDQYPEKYDLVVSTSSMSRTEWADCYVYACVIQAFHCMGFLRTAAKHAVQRSGITYRRFYEDIIDRMVSSRNTLSRALIADLKFTAASIICGKPDWNRVFSEYGPVVFPPEELFFMRAVLDAHLIYRELYIPDQLQNPREEDYLYPDNYETVEDWAREYIWYGRKGARAKISNQRRAAI